MSNLQCEKLSIFPFLGVKCMFILNSCKIFWTLCVAYLIYDFLKFKDHYAWISCEVLQKMAETWNDPWHGNPWS